MDSTVVVLKVIVSIDEQVLLFFISRSLAVAVLVQGAPVHEVSNFSAHWWTLKIKRRPDGVENTFAECDADELDRFLECLVLIDTEHKLIPEQE